MIRINLLPKAKRPSIWPSVEYAALAAALLIFLMVSVSFATGYYQIWSLKKEALEIEQQKLLLKQSAGNMKTTNERRQAIEAKTDLLLKLTKERVSFYALKSHLSEILPPEVWFSEISAKNNNRENNLGSATVNIRGRALSANDIAAFMQKLEQDEYLKDAVLLKAEKIDQSNGSQFEITAQIRQGLF
jgi:Tfp pilus assembly protein PilN